MYQSLNEGIDLLNLLDFHDRGGLALEPAAAEQLINLLESSSLQTEAGREAAFKDLVIFFDTLENLPVQEDETVPPPLRLPDFENETAAALYEWLRRTDYHQGCLAHAATRKQNAQRWESLAQRLAGDEQREAAVKALSEAIRRRLDAKL